MAFAAFITRVVAVCLLLMGVARATTYYVSPVGNDSRAGTSQATAWKSIEKVNSTTFLPGDSVLFQGGGTFLGGLSFGSGETGTAANPITISTYGTGKATINAAASIGMFFYNNQGFVISNLILTGNWDATNQAGNTGQGIMAYNDLGATTKLTYFRISNCEIKGFRSGGIVFGAYPADGTKSGYTDVQISNCSVHDNGDIGINTYGYFDSKATTYAHSSFLVTDCVTYSNRGIVNKGTNSGSGIALSDISSSVIQRCVAYLNGDLNNYAGGGPVGIWVWDATTVTVQFNESYQNKTGAGTKDGDGFDFDGGTTNSIFQYNYSHENVGAGLLVWEFSGARPAVSGNIVRFNIFQNDAQVNKYGEINPGPNTAVKNNAYYNNTLYATKGPAFNASNTGVGNAVQNNLFITTGGKSLVTETDTKAVFQGNAYWSSGAAFSIVWGGTTYTSLAAWRAATGLEMNGATATGLATDPQLNGPGTGGTIGNPDLLNTLTGYLPKATSPLINAGLNLTASPFNLVVGTRDFFGTTIPRAGGGYDIGAAQWMGTAPTIATVAAATPNPVTGTSTTLTVLGADDGGEANLTYTWALIGSTPAAVNFSANGTNAAKSTVASFTKAGTYNFLVTVADAGGLSATSSVTVVVSSSYSIWAADYSLGGTALDTPLNDGASNLLKYLFDINPTQAMSDTDRAALPVVEIDSTTNPNAPYLMMTYRQNPALSGVTVNVQTSTDLAAWSTVMPDLSGQSGTDLTTGDPMMRVRVKTNGVPKLFIRLNVTIP